MVREVVGFAPYERRVMELLKVGKDKRALKVWLAWISPLPRGHAQRSALSASNSHRQDKQRLIS